MKRERRREENRGTGALWVAAALLAALLATIVAAPRAEAAGLMKVKGVEDPELVIRSHRVDVVINNGFARTEVDQVFANTGDADKEAHYSFPLPKQASLSELSLWIEGVEVLGEVLEKEKARKLYEKQRDEGNDTALAEKDDYRTFDVFVGRVRAGSDTRVRLVYYQPLHVDQNVGRYLYPLAEGNVDEERIAFWTVDDQVEGNFFFHLRLKSAFPVKDVRLPGYDGEAVVQRDGPGGEAGRGEVIDVTVDRPEGAALSGDIVFYYRLDDTIPARLELVPYREDPGQAGTFMVVVTPAADLQPISEGSDWIFVLDVSGSMSGQKISKLADGVSRVLGKLRPEDRFRIVTFNDNSRDLTKGYLPAEPVHVEEWVRRVKSLEAGGSTALFAGLKEAYRGLDDDRSTGVILVTDGVANVGPTQHAAFLDLLRRYDIRLFTMVIGNSANQPLMDRLAKDSGGFAMNLSEADDVVGRIMQAKTMLTHECLHDVELVFHGERVRDLTPAVIGNLYHGEQLVIFGRYASPGEVELEMKARVSGTEKSWRTRIELPETDTENPEVERLWALSRIDGVMETIREKGESETLRKRVADLGTEYSLVTDYTSMVVVREDVYESEGIDRRNAGRVQRERAAQQARSSAPVSNRRVDGSGGGGGMFGGRTSPGFGSGPVGPLAVGILAWLNRKRRGRRR